MCFVQGFFCEAGASEGFFLFRGFFDEGGGLEGYFCYLFSTCFNEGGWFECFCFLFLLSFATCLFIRGVVRMVFVFDLWAYFFMLVLGSCLHRMSQAPLTDLLSGRRLLEMPFTFVFV